MDCLDLSDRLAVLRVELTAWRSKELLLNEGIEAKTEECKTLRTALAAEVPAASLAAAESLGELQALHTLEAALNDTRQADAEAKTTASALRERLSLLEQEEVSVAATPFCKELSTTEEEVEEAQKDKLRQLQELWQLQEENRLLRSQCVAAKEEERAFCEREEAYGTQLAAVERKFRTLTYRGSPSDREFRLTLWRQQRAAERKLEDLEKQLRAAQAAALLRRKSTAFLEAASSAAVPPST